MTTFFDYAAPNNLLSNHVILVTGAGDGIGRAAAITYAQHGATAGLAQPIIYPMNLLNITVDDCETLAEAINNEFGKLNGVLHNAGLLGAQTSIEKYDDETWRQVFQVNVHAPFMLTQSLLPLMEKTDNASIIFTSSGVVQRGRAYWGAYSASKAASNNLMQILSEELMNTSTIRVNAINPGGTRTAMRALAYPGENPNTNPKPEEIMAAYLYLMGGDSVGVTGKTLQAQIK
jgi:NAD(P)-dependent dehydrogenase (short-subunit alcohol dehydrogenase family)